MNEKNAYEHSMTVENQFLRVSPEGYFFFSGRQVDSAPYCTMLHCIAVHCTVLHCTVLHCTILYYTVLRCIALHRIAIL